MKNNIDEENKKLREQVRFLRRQNVQLSQRRRIKLLTMMDSEPFKVGVLSDTHMGSHFDNLDWLNSAYEVFVKEKVKFIIHAGDIVDGQGNYRGQEYEQHSIGFDAQLKYCIENYPRTKLITYLVSGNHSFKKISGAEIGRVITQFRPDLQYIGEEYGNLIIKMSRGAKIWIQILHPSGGRSYALSYKPQKIVESMTGGTKPNILIIGHFHSWGYFSPRNVECVMAGAVQCQTPYMRRKHMSADVGFSIIEFTANKGGITSFVAKRVPFYEKVSDLRKV